MTSLDFFAGKGALVFDYLPLTSLRSFSDHCSYDPIRMAWHQLGQS